MPETGRLRASFKWWLAAAALTAAIRVVYWAAVGDEAWFRSPGMDPQVYTDWADAIIAGDAARFIPFPRAPLYPYLLALLRSVFGTGMLPPRLLNLALDLLTSRLLFTAAGRVGGLTAAVVAGILYALCGAAVYFSGEILMTSAAICLAAGIVCSGGAMLEHPSLKRALLPGILTGLLCLLRPNALLLVPAVILLLFATKVAAPRRLAAAAAAFTLPVVVILTPVMMANVIHGGGFTPVSTQGGVNFYIGNARGATGWASSLPGSGASWSGMDAQLHAERIAGERLTPAGESALFWKLGLRELKADPSGALQLYLRKLLLLVNIREIGNNRPLRLAVWAAPWMKLLFFFSLGGMLPLALVGWSVSRHSPHARFGLLFVLVYGGSLLLFFVNTRYRMPLVPVVTLFAGVGVAGLVGMLRGNGAWRRAAAPLAAGLLLAFPPWVSGVNDAAQAHFVAGNALLREGNPTAALERYHAAAQNTPDYPELHLNRGVALLRTGDTLAAEGEFRLETAANVNNYRAWNNLGVILESRGETDSALTLFSRSADLNPHFRDAAVNIAGIHLKRGDKLFTAGALEDARREYIRAQDAAGADAPILYRRALVAGSAGDVGRARELLREALKADPEYKPATDLLRRLEVSG